MRQTKFTRTACLQHKLSKENNRTKTFIDRENKNKTTLIDNENKNKTVLKSKATIAYLLLLRIDC